jgi:hypothetical protein
MADVQTRGKHSSASLPAACSTSPFPSGFACCLVHFWLHPMSILPPPSPSLDDLLDDGGWEDMPIVRDMDEFAGVAGGLDQEDQKRYHYNPQTKKDSSQGGASNATGAILDIDYQGSEWRSKVDQNESEYTRLRMREEEDADEVHLRTRYLFDEDQAMTPLSQMQQTKNMLTEAQRIAYVGLCALVSTEMLKKLKGLTGKDSKSAIQDMVLWRLKILGRLYYHMELATAGAFSYLHGVHWKR